MLYPLLFKPIFQERIWGGRSIETLYRKPLPPQIPIGESWEVSDRPEADSEITNGPLAGRTLHWLMENHEAELMGRATPQKGRFPLLVKILDAREKLSLQVHPPASKAAALKGEPKTEMWYITSAEPKAELYVGLRTGTTPEEFRSRIKEGTVAECFHAVSVKAGDSMFLPSGRVHAIGAGLVIFEIQQNSDTTYRVFDWNRVDAQGKPRQLHVEQSLECIDFKDFEPEAVRDDTTAPVGKEARRKPLVQDLLFEVDSVTLGNGSGIEESIDVPHVIGMIEGSARILHPELPVELAAGQFCLVPAGMKKLRVEPATPVAKLLIAKPG